MKVGDKLKPGERIARIGNNGYGSPRIHIGAWRGKAPLQILWDQTKMKLPPDFRGSD